MTTLTLPVEQEQKKVPWFGRPWELKHALVAGIGSVFLCYLYVLGTRRWAPEFEPGAVEFWGTTTSLWCVWITQKRNILSLPIGIVSVMLMGYFFMTIDLPGQMLLHWLYYIPIQAWAWYNWRVGGENQTELKVTKLTWELRAVCVALYVALTAVFGLVLTTGWDNSLYTYWDASIVAASVIAQVLLSTKKLESWFFWILPVNIAAIGLYLKTDANMFAALYMLFLAMAFVGLYRWNKAAKAHVA